MTVCGGKYRGTLARAAPTELRENQQDWQGDFCPLTPRALNPGRLTTSQFRRHRLWGGFGWLCSPLSCLRMG